MRSFEIKKIIRRYNNDFKDKATHSNANDPNYIKALTELLSMKDQSSYLPQRLKMYHSNKDSTTIQLHTKANKGISMSMSPCIRSKTIKGSFYISGYDSCNKANKQHCIKLKPLANQFRYLTPYATSKSGINSTKAYRQLHTEEAKTKDKEMKSHKENQLDNSQDIFFKPPNEYPKEREIENELNKQYQFLPIKTNMNSPSNKNIQAIVNRIKKLNNITMSDKERNNYLMQSNKSYLLSQNNFFKVLYMRMKKEKQNNNNNIKNKPQINNG